MKYFYRRLPAVFAAVALSLLSLNSVADDAQPRGPARALVLGRTPIRKRRLLTWCNTPRRIASTMCIQLAVFTGASQALAQSDTRSRDDPAAATLPDPAAVVTAYMSVQSWVRSFDPPSPDEDSARLPIGNAEAVCVMLRHRGVVLGTGTDATGDDLMVRRAAGRALSAVLGHPLLANIQDEKRARIGGQLTTELEVAGPRVPLPGRRYACSRPDP